MKRRTIRTVSTIAVTGALLVGGAGVAGAADGSSRATAEKHAVSAADSAKKHRNHRVADSTLTAAQKEKASAAALAKVPGTVHHVRADRVGGYTVIVTATDGTKTAVKLDKDFKVTGTEAAKDREKAGSKGSRSGKHSGGTSAAA